jgi:predicted metalloprotease with PDZ domain
MRRTAFVFLFLLPACFAQSSTPLQLHVDLTDAPRHIIHARVEIPVTPGPITLEYPEWIPGDHRPTGPIDNLAGIFVRANGKEIPWRRDSVDLYGIHVEVPQGVNRLEVALDFLATRGFTGSDDDQATSADMTVLEWNGVVLYPASVPVAKIPITTTLTVPAGWKFGTALPVTSQQGNEVSFGTVPVEMLIDSPVITGRYFREYALAPEVTPKHYLDVAGDAAADVDLKPEFVDAISKLVREAGALYQSRHYETYHFLLSLSDVIRGEGLEHHQSSDNGIDEKGVSDASLALLNADLLPHEFTHSWNGKYRRPIGLATPDYKTPQQGDLLWVYEGMTQYWGDVLSARTGLWTVESYREALAWHAANLDVKPGRIWRNLEDTAISSSILRSPSMAWNNWRRDQDYYYEGELVWLDADTTIRSLTNGKKSLNDFCVKFLAVGGNTPPKVVPYDFDEIVADLNSVVPYDWRGFLMERLNTHADHAPLDGITHGGYRLAYSTDPTAYEKALMDYTKRVDAWFSLGLYVSLTGNIQDVRIGSPADKAGLGPDTMIVAVDGHAFTPDVLKQAIRDAKGTSTPMELIVSTDKEFRTVQIHYHDGERYPQLQRVDGTPARLDEILKPLL